MRYALICLAPYSFYYDESKTKNLLHGLLQYAVALNDLHNFWLPAEDYLNLLRKEYLDMELPIDEIDLNNVYEARDTELRMMSPQAKMNLRKDSESWNKKNYPETRAENIKILDDYLTLCEKNNIRPIIYLPPCSECYTKYFCRTKLEEFYYLIDSAMKKHSSTVFVDGWKLPGFSDDDFYDAFHMNIQGSAKFSAILNDFIEQLENN